jgi:hypothetical protein
MKGVPYRVYVVAPRRKKEGRNWQLLAKPPAGSAAKRMRKTSKTTDHAEASARAAAWEALLNGLAAPLTACATFGDLAAKHLAHRETDGTPAEPYLSEHVASILAYRAEEDAARLVLRDAQVALDSARAVLGQEVAEVLADPPRVGCASRTSDWRARLGPVSARERAATEAWTRAQQGVVAAGHRFLRSSGVCPGCGGSLVEGTCYAVSCVGREGCDCDGCRP